MTTPLPPAYFLSDGDAFVPTTFARGPWGETISGMVIGGLLGHVIDRDTGDPELQPARLTVDLLRPAGIAPLTARTTVVRQGRRLKLVEATVTLSRLPVGPYLGLAALTHSSDEGVAAGSAAIFDLDGLIGAATVTALANPGFTPPSMP